MSSNKTIFGKRESLNKELLEASKNGEIWLVKELLNNKADIEAKCNGGFTPLILASKNGHLEVVKELLNRRADIEAKDNNGYNPLICASLNANVEVVIELLNRNANIEAKSNGGYTALILASWNGHIDVVKELVNRKANIEAKNNYGYNPIISASSNGHLQVVTELLKNGANIEEKDDDLGRTPLLCASSNAKIEVVKELLNKKADIEAKDNNGFTPLIFASRNGHMQVVVELINKKADIEAKSNSGYTPLIEASLNGRFEVAKELLEKGASVKPVTFINSQSALHKASEKGHKDVVFLLLTSRAEYNYHDKDGLTAFHIAARFGKIEVIQVFLDQGVDIRSKSKDGKTVADLALENGHHTLVEFLSKHLNDGSSYLNTLKEENEKPIQLIECDNNNLCVNPVALNRIRDLNQKISSVSVLGPYRTGKSTLMNFLSSSDQLIKTRFQVNASAYPCTKGVWMFMIIKNEDEAILLFDTEGLDANSSSENWDNKLFLFNLLISSLLIYNTLNVIERSKMFQLVKMTDLCCQLIRNRINEDDNPDFLWILRDFDFKAANSDANQYFEDQITRNNQNIFKYFKNRRGTFLPPCNNMDSRFKDSINSLKSLIFNSLVKRKTFHGSFLNGQEFAEFVLIISKQINETNVINYGALATTYDNVARENLKRIKSNMIIKLEDLKEEIRDKPMKWEKFNEIVTELKKDFLNEFKSKIKQDEEFQREYIDELSLFMDDKIYVSEVFNRDQLEYLHKGILESLLNPLLEKINSDYYNHNELSLEEDLKEIEIRYKKSGIESPELAKILNEQFTQLSQVLKKVDLMKFKIVEEKNGELLVSESKYSFSKALMNIFKDLPMLQNKFSEYGEKSKQDEIEKLREKVRNDDVFNYLKIKLVGLLNDEFNEFRILNSKLLKNLTIKNNEGKCFDIFLSYRREGMKEEVKAFKDRLSSKGFKVWFDEERLHEVYGQNYTIKLIDGIENSNIFIFLWNNKYCESEICMKEFRWAVSKNEKKKIKIMSIELEKIDLKKCENKLIQFHLGPTTFNPKIYKFENCKISEILEQDFNNLVESIKNL